MAGTRYIVVAEETTFGDGETPTIYNDLVTEKIAPNPRYILQDTSRARAPTQKFEGMYLNSGDILFLGSGEGITPYMVKWNFGDVTDDDVEGEAGAYSHVFVPLGVPPSFAFNLGLETFTREFAGGIVDELSIEATVGKPLYMTAGIFAKEEEKGSIGVPSYSTVKPFNWTQCVVKFAQSQVKYVQALKVNFRNQVPIDQLYGLGDGGLQRSEVSLHSCDGSLGMSFPDSTEYDRFIADAEFALQLKAEGAKIADSDALQTFQLDIPQLLLLTDGVPHIDRQTPFKLEIPFRGEWDPSLEYDASITMINGIETI
jgi:hypothetical protein